MLLSRPGRPFDSLACTCTARTTAKAVDGHGGLKLQNVRHFQ